jgi:release factor glutamine methyltransferase
MAFGLPASGHVSVRSPLPQAGTPVRDALDGAVTAIAAGGCDSPRLDAELLLAHVLGVERERLLSDERLEVAGGAVRAFQQAVRRRAIEREPVAYIVGRRAFRNLQLGIDCRALIPRPDSELLVEAALALPAGARVLDVGTGCGAIALALKDERPDLEISGSDCSSPALELAAENSTRLGLDVRWLRADLLSGVPDEFDAVLANLPYVRDAERRALAPEILRHEPPGALFAGPDGLTAITALLAQLVRRATVAMLALEVGAGQAPAVAGMTRAAGYARVRCERDLAGIERVVVGEGRRR